MCRAPRPAKAWESQRQNTIEEVLDWSYVVIRMDAYSRAEKGQNPENLAVSIWSFALDEKASYGGRDIYFS